MAIKLDTKVCPDGPCVVVGQLTTCGDAMANSFPHKVEIMLESNSLVGWTYVQEGCVGKVWSMWIKNAVSSKAKEREQQSARVLVVPLVKIGVKVKGMARRALAR